MEARPAAARAHAQGRKTREARARSAVCALRALGRVGAEPDSKLKFQGAKRTGVSASGSNGLFVWDVILDPWRGGDG